MRTFLIICENQPGVLYRVADVFLRRKINIQSLTVTEIEKGLSRFTVLADVSEEESEKISKQIYKIVEVIKVVEAEDQDLVVKELAVFKVKVSNPKVRQEIEDILYLYKAKIIHVSDESVYIEKTGTEEEIDSFYNFIKPYGIQEIVRSGRIGMLKRKRDLGRISFSWHPPAFLDFVDVSAIKKIELYAREFKDTVSLAQGTPSFPNPDFVKQAAKEAIDKGLSDRYTPGYGIDELREAIVEKVKRDNNLLVSKNNVIVTHGAIQALMTIFLSLFSEEDEIIVLTPDYASHITQIKIAKRKGRPVFVPLKPTKDGWKIDFSRLEAAITMFTKAILVCNPSNPLGKVYSREELENLLNIAKKHNLFIITDEIYEYFVFDGRKHISIASLPGAFERTISIFGVSKSFSMTGWRIGYIVAEEEVVRQLFKVHDSIVTCPTAISQYAALQAIRYGNEYPLQLKKEYESRRDYVFNYLSQSNKVELIKPEGAYYAFVKIKGLKDDYSFAYELVENARVALVPGSAFGLGGEGYMRLSFCVDEERLKTGLERFLNYVEKKL